MRKIVNGKLYDTDKAILIGEASRSYRIIEALYKTQKGSYFLYSEREIKKDYEEQFDIKPLTPGEALEWLQNHDADISVLRELFNEEIEEA